MDPAAPPDASALLQLDPLEARVIGCLIEKASITPEAYPLTVNALVAACNQKTSRDPLMQAETGAVAHALRSLEDKGLVKLAPASQRALRYEHRFDGVYAVTARQRAVLCVMLLRGPQTLAELLSRCERLAEFPGLDDVRDTVERLLQRQPPLLVRLGRGPGQREDRYMHLLAGAVNVERFAAASGDGSAPATASASARSDWQARVGELEHEVQALRADLERLRDRLDVAGV